MNIVIIGGNECMVCRYKKICKKYRCQAKIFAKMSGTLRGKIGNPDMLVLFTGTLSHKMLRCAQSEIKGKENEMIIARCQSSSASALSKILEQHVG